MVFPKTLVYCEIQFAPPVQDSHAYSQYEEMMSTTDKIEVLGELKVSGIIFKKVDIEASFRAGMSNEAKFKEKVSATSMGGKAAQLLAVYVISETSVQRISVPGRNADKDCVDDMFISPEIIKNQYIPKDASTSVWVTLNCTESDAVDLVTKGQDAAPAPEGDLCYYLDE